MLKTHAAAVDTPSRAGEPITRAGPSAKTKLAGKKSTQENPRPGGTTESTEVLQNEERRTTPAEDGTRDMTKPRSQRPNTSS
jgi:hypothetical protein